MNVRQGVELPLLDQRKIANGYGLRRTNIHTGPPNGGGSVAAFASALLEELGYETLRAQTALEALDVMATSHDAIDAVFSDVMMPGGMDGLQLATRLRERYPQVAVVLASGYSDALRNWEGARPAEVLSKPYRMDELGQALSQAFEKTRSA